MSPFSARAAWDLHPNRLTQLLDARRRAAREVLDLTVSNPTQIGFEYPEGLAEVLGGADAMVYAPAPRGLQSAREAVAGYYAARGERVYPERLLLTASTSEAYGFLFKLLADPGCEVLVPAPCYPLFAYLAGLEAIRTVSYPLVYEDRWRIDLPRLAAAVTPSTRAVVVINPHNPAGAFVHRDEHAQLTALAWRHDLALISDEVFSDYAMEPDADASRVPFLARRDEVLAFSLSGLSKVAALPQMKLGWIAVAGPDPQRRSALQRLDVIADAYLSVGTPVMAAAAALLAAAPGMQVQIRARLQENRAALVAALTKVPEATVLRAEGGWYAVIRFPRTVDEESFVVRLLAERGVLVHPGYFFDFPSEGYLVLTLLPPPSTFREGAARLAEALREAVASA